jgi:integrase/recombinase XerD
LLLAKSYWQIRLTRSVDRSTSCAAAKPFLTEDQARHLLADIDTPTVVGPRDRALIGMMAYTVARIGAVAGMRVEDHFPRGKRFYVKLHEKGGKQHEMPAHRKLEGYIEITAAGIGEDERGPSSLRLRAKRAS